MTLDDIRHKIASIDEQIIELLAQRVALAEDVLRYKHQENMSINDENQNTVVIERSNALATEHNLDTAAVKEIFEILIRMNIERQHELSGEGNLP
ncbi:chorismate mutase [Methanohalophilus levihalophilus]|uniref:chorismate mutase n=1 Tax=Methanohalophilus levihalophilus TaxID=1431282 RepID=UPI001AE35E1C|nr:chorismate mutase [Methanohalophilus levihalophilus]MBP2029550.1 chorismate mutase [Methanohalophilus levihalophilus]